MVPNPNSHAAQKQAFRSALLSQRQALSAGEISARSKKIFTTFLQNLERVMPAEFASVALYFPIRGEVDTRDFFKHFRKRSKRCLFPLSQKEPAPQSLAFYEVSDWSELKLGTHGIGEPRPRPGVQPQNPDLVFVPALAYTADAHRLGFGAGFYDRAIDAWSAEGRRSSMRLLGLAYDFQIVPELPRESHDEQLDFVIGEEQVFSKGDKQ